MHDGRFTVGPKKDGSADGNDGIGVVSFLPTLLQLRSDLRTIDNAISAYEQACFRGDFTGARVEADQARAFAIIQKRLQTACDRLDVRPQERRRLQAALEKARATITTLQHKPHP